MDKLLKDMTPAELWAYLDPTPPDAESFRSACLGVILNQARKLSIAEDGALYEDYAMSICELMEDGMKYRDLE